MAITNPLGGQQTRSPGRTTGPVMTLIGALIAAAAIVAMPHQVLPQDALLPAASLMLYLLAAVVALLAWRRPVPVRGLSYRDVAGVLVFIGILVSTQVEPEQMVRLLTAAHDSK